MIANLSVRLKILCLSTLFILVISCHTMSETLELSTLEWPPFTGTALIDAGITSKIVAQALRYEGHELNTTVLPWNRAVRMVKIGQIIGYFPEYLTTSNDFLFSKSLGMSSIGLLEHKTKPIIWNTVSDLNQYALGVVDGYVNTAEIDEMILNGSQTSETAKDDKQNILKLAVGRIDTIVIDVNVYEFLKSDPQIAKVAPLLQINQKILAHKSLHVALINDQQGLKWLEIINRGLLKFDVQAAMDASLQEIRQNK
ncbi:transporter substrate-binding domain-containing protein [Shewanella sp. SG41-4]|uniref:substrate-binding periplasmic protein n=1 Tax=Shewanella sp. SG41-4 TaxID=2760976 RepID=UPI001602E49B|nr:transporter substrate-binding domain-containing protein [Shewanella sp. SG41-4]MBB1438002.1 transporter substrate-binding domain-containing protein [Shewanella sp. SG41-4]